MNPVRILDFDGSVVEQKKLLAYCRAEIIDFSDIGPAARLWLNKKDREEIARRLGASDRGAVTFLGSGDFHHTSEILISRFEEPLTLIDFDRHPDRSFVAPRHSCGAWVRAVLKNKNIKKYILIGALKGSHPESIKRLPTGKVYVTIDKDCLTRESALTNWEEGSMRLDELLGMLKVIRDNFEIAGVDICGDYSRPVFKGALKSIVAYFDHPKNFSAKGIPGSKIAEVNEATNLRILGALGCLEG